MNINKNIKASNQWLAKNRKKAKKITLKEVKNRLEKNNLLSIEADSKTKKGSKNGYLTGILYFAPHKITGFNLCPFATDCIKPCLFSAGRGAFNDVTRARIIKTLGWLMDSEKFKNNLRKDILSLVKKAKKRKMQPLVRLNGTSDILIEKAFKDILSEFPEVIFYDYTKNPNRKNLPKNYHLTFSYDGKNKNDAIKHLKKGINVAAVFSGKLPKKLWGYEVINGDKTDARPSDKKGIIVGLTAKGPDKKTDSNFFIKEA
jgi:hypothetical protein